MAPTVGWLGRTFGWSGGRDQWLMLLGSVGWLAGLIALGWKSADWTIGQSLLAAAGWLFVLGLAARAAVRDLFGPVFFYDLLRVSRSRTTFLLRGFYILCLGGFLGLMYNSWLESHSVGSVTSHTVISKFATEFFEAFMVLQFCVVVLLTPVYVAGTIAVEKERKTLEFLLATDLRNREIIFGKLASRVLTLVMYVLAGLPLMAFLQLFGGIDPEQLLAGTTATLVMILGLSALSIWVSTSLRKARDAIVLTYLLALVYTFASFLLAILANAPWGIIGWWNTPVNLFGISMGVHDILSFFADGNPLWAFFKLGTSTTARSGLTDVLRDYVVFWGIAIALLLGSAILRIRRVTLAQAYGPVGRRQRVRSHPRAEGARRERGSSRRSDDSSRPALSGNPVTWKEVFVDATFRGGWIGRFVAIVILILTFIPFGIIVYIEFIDRWWSGYVRNRPLSVQWEEFTEETNGWVRIVTGVLGFLMFIAAAMRGAGAISGEKDRDTWISLLSTPLSAAEILHGKWWGCVMSLRRVFCVLLLVWSVGLATGSIMPAMMLVMLPLTLIYVSAFSWIGLYCSMTARTTLIASVRGFFAALFCVGGFWIVLLCCCFGLFRHGSGDGIEQLISVMLGATPPVVYGFFPLHGMERRDLAFFDPELSRSAGMVGPVIGTTFWLAFNFIMARICHEKFREITNRGEIPYDKYREVKKREVIRRPPRREGPGDSSETAD